MPEVATACGSALEELETINALVLELRAALRQGATARLEENLLDSVRDICSDLKSLQECPIDLIRRLVALVRELPAQQCQDMMAEVLDLEQFITSKARKPSWMPSWLSWGVPQLSSVRMP